MSSGDSFLGAGRFSDYDPNDECYNRNQRNYKIRSKVEERDLAWSFCGRDWTFVNKRSEGTAETFIAVVSLPVTIT